MPPIACSYGVRQKEPPNPSPHTSFYSISKRPIVYEIPADEYVTSALACQDDRILMTIYSPNSPNNTEVRMWQPDGTTKSLLKSDKELQLLSCR